MGTNRHTDNPLTVNDCAERLGVSERTVRNMIARGDLRAYQIGGRLIRISLADFESIWKPVRGGAFD